MHKQPQITERTRETFIETFWLMYKDSPAGQIKIGELSQKAGYNRSTFYEYFTDIYDLLHQAEDGLINEFKIRASEKFPDGIKNVNYENTIRTLVELFDLLGEKMFLLIGENGDPSFQNKLRKQVMPFLQQMMGQDFGKYADYVSSFSFSGAIGILKFWHENKKDISEEEIVTLLVSLLTKGIWRMQD
ncbi:MAG: TetR family transcriptional regulator C-terminal domain-containing protein [Clostridia bacterium]|nr:TetR family transcriptional regulator C-terminal domain-containing protein [Clostridia bacterium]